MRFMGKSVEALPELQVMHLRKLVLVWVLVLLSCHNLLPPENVGPTALVVVICSSHIIISNCGDSRAVLYRRE